MTYNDIAVKQQATVCCVCQYVCMCDVTNVCAVGMCYTSVSIKYYRAVSPAIVYDRVQ